MLPRLRDLLKSKRAQEPAPSAEAASTEPAQARPSPAVSAGASWQDVYEQAQALQRRGESEQAIGLFGRIIEASPERAEPHYKRANAFNSLGRLEEALADYDRAILLDPSFAYAYCNRGSVLERLGRKQEALTSFDRALELDPRDALTHYNRGSVLKDLKLYQRALASYETAIKLNSVFADAYVNRGNVLQKLERHEAAIESFRQAIALKPTLAEAFLACGISLYGLKRFQEAADQFGHVLALNPTMKYVIGEFLEAKLQVCCWEGFDQDRGRIVEGLRERRPVCAPLKAMLLTDSTSLLQTAAQIWVHDQIWDRDTRTDLERLGSASREPVAKRRPAKLHIGYFSADFRAHPVAYLAAGLFERHDRSRFEISALAFGPETNDAMAARLGKSFDRFVDVRQKSDLEVAALARELKVDIAVDLNGFTEHNRTKIFALRAAPIQISYLGYPGTMGADFIDYLVADGTVVPRAQRAYYLEKIAYLPGSFLPFDSSFTIADRAYTREQLGLPPTGFVFCCFNRNHKILPEVFARWMEILNRTEGSVLWLHWAEAVASANLRKEASRAGIDAKRLIFASRMASLPEHLARLRAADLFLDTFPYNAHATAMDALWAGVPVLTYPGDGFASRVAASLLRTSGLSELIAASPAEYEAMAVRLAAEPSLLGKLREGLAQQSKELFDIERYTQDLEAVYEAMHERYRLGLPAAHINEHLAG
jgi:predicted O-linked N-acetylglucosamine transferase (SPINDLY family)